ncbi:ATP-binding cassette domain-containing protein [Alicyclobacillus fodiniaquatilis]|uniref:ATP-binding cassette domain-containing protein n=1 Tax=Alicyclobacillus fodiniaquatilis TaxID=1661150 RepID=A0ABW4JF41_9BACL
MYGHTRFRTWGGSKSGEYTRCRHSLRLVQATKSYARRRVLDGITLTIYEKETLGIIGSNGSGKSTLLRLITGLVPPSAGKREVIKSNLRTG